MPKTINVRETKKELQINPTLRNYESTPQALKPRRRRQLTEWELGREEAKLCGGGRYNFDYVVL